MQQLVGYLKDALSGHDHNAQKHATMVGLKIPPLHRATTAV